MVHKKPVLAIIADIINSKGIPEREVFQRRLHQKLNEINNEVNTGLISPYTITLGDEFQAVYQHTDQLIRHIFDILEEAHPYQLRFALGYDILSTDINPTSAIGMDGPAFHQARRGLEHLKDHKSTIIQIYGDYYPNIKFVNESLKIWSKEQAKWKENTNFIFRELMKGSTKEAIAEKIGISERAVYKQLNTHLLDHYVSLLKLIPQAISQHAHE